jgi:hypothetical protein
MNSSFAAALAAAIALTAGVDHAAAPTLVRTTPLPAVGPGDFDQFAVDLKRDRLYLSAEAAGAIEVFDLRSGALLRSGGPVKTPHKLAVDVATGHLFVADGKDGAVEVLDADLKLVTRIPTGSDPDGGLQSPEGVFYVGSRLSDPAATTSTIAAISMGASTIVNTVPAPAHTLKAMVIDPATGRLFVSMRDRNQIGIVDLKRHVFRGVWGPAGLTQPVPLALDRADGLLFVGARKPGRLFALDAADGHVVKELDCTDVSDSMSYDARARRLYVTGDSGLSIYRVQGRSDIRPVGLYPTVAGKTSLLVKSLNRLYVARPKTADHGAALEIYALQSGAQP